ncbi:hypothetical protein TNCV_4710141 [Trichonephila clavipes]|nr:hypothetical protein TNCV_4710141 [Trichonephila clavipes]
MRTRCLKCSESHRTSDGPIKRKIANPIHALIATRQATWPTGTSAKNFLKKAEKVKRLTIVTPSKNQKLTNPQTGHTKSLPQPPFQALPNKNNIPGTSAASEEVPTTNEKTTKGSTRI